MADLVERRANEVFGLVSPMIDDAEWLAGRAVTFVAKLQRAVAPRRERYPISQSNLLEIAAIIRISMWQRDNVAVKIGADFPPSSELLEQWVAKVFVNGNDRRAGDAGGESPFYDRVVRLWFDHCSWSAAPNLGRDIVVGEVEEGLLLEFWMRILRS